MEQQSGVAEHFFQVLNCLHQLTGALGNEHIKEAEYKITQIPKHCPYYCLILLDIALYSHTPFRQQYCSTNDSNNFHFQLHNTIQQNPNIQQLVLTPSVRQLAALLLKGFIKSYWHADQHILPNQIKKELKEIIPLGLIASDTTTSKISTAISMIIAEISEHDFPDEWPNLIEIIIKIYEGSNSEIQSFGALKCLSLVAQHFTDKQTIVAFPVLTPYMLTIAANTQIPQNVRAKALTVCIELFYLLGMTAGDGSVEEDDFEDDEGIESEDREEDIYTKVSAECKNLLNLVLEPTLKLILSEISTPILSVEGNCSFKMECVKLMNVLVKEFGLTIEKYIMSVLQSTCNSLEKEYDLFLKYLVLPSKDTGLESNAIAEHYDSEGESVNFSTVVCQQIELLSTIVCNPKLGKILSSNRANLIRLIYLMIGYSQLTLEQEEVFESDPEQFVNEEEDEYANYSIRIACQGLLDDFCEMFGYLGTNSLIAAFNQRMEESKQLYQSNPNHSSWWKLREASLLSISSFSSFREQLMEEQELLDMNNIIGELLQNDLQLPSNNLPFLKSRAIQCTSFHLFYLTNNLDAIKQLLLIYVEHLNPQTQPVPIRLYACRAVARVFQVDHVETVVNNCENKDEMLKKILVGMCQLANEVSDEVMHIPLESIAIFVKFSPQVVIPFSNEVITIMWTQLEKFANDHTIASDIINVFEKLALIPEIEYQLVNFVSPKIAQIISGNLVLVGMHFVEKLLDVGYTIIRHSTKEQIPFLLNTLFPSIMNIILSNDDEDLLQHGTECIRAFIHSGQELVVQHRLQEVSSFQLILEYIQKLLLPDLMDGSSLGVGELISEIFTKVGKLLDMNIISQIIKAAVIKLAATDSLALTQSIIFIFAKLFHEQNITEMLNLLSSITDLGETNINHYKTGLECLMRKWAKNQQNFFGLYKLKVTSTSLAKLLESGDQRLAELTVIIETTETKSKKRYQTRLGGSIKEKEIPFIIHAFTLIVDAYIRAKEFEKSRKESNKLEGILYGEEEEDNFVSEEDYLAHLVGGANDYFDDEDDIEDPIEKIDPLNQINLLIVLPQMVKEFCSVNQQIVPHLQKILSKEQKQAFEEMMNATTIQQ
ncbi:hypothetical protein ABK040_003162 [Willaertia magna]